MDIGSVVTGVKGIELKPMDSEEMEVPLGRCDPVFEFALVIFVWGAAFRQGVLLDFAADTPTEAFKTKTLLAVGVPSSRYFAATADAAVVGDITRNRRKMLAAW
jgi:hypothetical protein